jgi:hypothetical protein
MDVPVDIRIMECRGLYTIVDKSLQLMWDNKQRVIMDFIVIETFPRCHSWCV